MSLKWAVRRLFRSARSKMEKFGYRMNLVAPWIVDAPMSESLIKMQRKNWFPVVDAKSIADAVRRRLICGPKVFLPALAL